MNKLEDLLILLQDQDITEEKLDILIAAMRYRNEVEWQNHLTQIFNKIEFVDDIETDDLWDIFLDSLIVFWYDKLMRFKHLIEFVKRLKSVKTSNYKLYELGKQYINEIYPGLPPAQYESLIVYLARYLKI
jgi:hypothetical protein